MKHVADDIWTCRFPLRFLGADQGRVVTTIRLSNGDVVIHSTAPFASSDVKAISAQGRPRWLVDAMLLHDTYAKEGMAAFPGLPLLAPDGFSEAAKVPAEPLFPAPEEWTGELEVLALEGVPRLKEHVFFHRPSRTLIVTDFVFHFDYKGTAWEQFLRRYLMGLKHQPGITRVFRAFIKDRTALKTSVRQMMEWDFDRVICGHKEMVESDGKARLRRALVDAGLHD